MTTHPPFRKVFDGVATREEMFRLFNHHRDDPNVHPVSGKPYSSEWFEIEPAQYHFMLGLLPPLFQRSGMFGLSEYKAGNVTSVFFAIRIRGRERFFHGFCDLGDRQSPDKMRAAIIAHEIGAADSMTLEEKLEAIWSATHPDFKGIAGKSDLGDWPADHHGKRFVFVRGGPDRVLKLLEELSDDEIDIRIAGIRAHRGNRRGPTDADPS